GSISSADDLQTMISFTKPQFEELFTYTDPVEDETFLRYVKRKDLILFLCKLRQGLSDFSSKLIFSYPSRQVVSLKISTVRKSLLARFVWENFPKAVIIADGTYSYIEKSGNYRKLRQSYSVHKGRHLVKPALLVATYGFILDVQGPYFADGRNNDAEILRNELNQNIND
ncbi:hypothetical protein HHI36_014836, partial [Cryptolaemus montrouzieri]